MYQFSSPPVPSPSPPQNSSPAASPSSLVAWNRAAEDLWGLKADEVLDRTFLALDIRLPHYQLVAPIPECLAGEESSTTVHAHHRPVQRTRSEVFGPARSPGRREV